MTCAGFRLEILRYCVFFVLGCISSHDFAISRSLFLTILRCYDANMKYASWMDGWMIHGGLWMARGWVDICLCLSMGGLVAGFCLLVSRYVLCLLAPDALMTD